MRDVRTVFGGLAIAAVISIVVLAIAAVRRNDRVAHAGGPCRQGAIWLVAVVVGLGVFALVAFDTLFAVFHGVLFPAGSYDFDPATERLVQLFPFQFWQESAIAVGIVIVAISAVVGIVAHGRASRPSPQATADQATSPVAEPG